jgi:MltA-interacting protein MipA
MAYAENFYTFGLGTGVAPRYLGSKDYRGLVAPVFSAEFSNGFFISPLEGAGYKKTFANGMFVSTALFYDFGRSDTNRADLPGSNYLKGMGRIPGSLMMSFQVGATVFGDTTISVTLDQPLTNTTRGVSGHLDVTKPVLSRQRHQHHRQPARRQRPLYANVLRRHRRAVGEQRLSPRFGQGRHRPGDGLRRLDLFHYAEMVGADIGWADTDSRFVRRQPDRAKEERLFRHDSSDV